MGQKGFWTVRSRRPPSTITERPVRTAAPDHSIWRDLSEETFRRNVVTLSKCCNEVGWKEDVLARASSSPAIVERPVMTPRSSSDNLSYHVPLEVERRLSSDMAFIAATEAGPLKVTAACIEENLAENEIKLWLAANAGVEEGVEEALLQMWDTVVAGVDGTRPYSSTADAYGAHQRVPGQHRQMEDLVFDQIVRLNRARIRSRIRNALGYAPEHVAPASRSSWHAYELRKAIKYTRRHVTGRHGQAFLTSLGDIHAKMISINKSCSKGANIDEDDMIVEGLKELTKMCFSLTNKQEDGQIALFRDILRATGLDANKCDKLLNERSVTEIEKIGSYRRISRTLLKDCLEFCREGQKPPRLRIERVDPYQPTSSKVSISSKSVGCHVHAEIQLLCKWLMLPRENQRLPRCIGASKLSCFLCFLCLSCCGGPSPPRPHGRIYDQWTIPDNAEFDDKCIDILRRTIALMDQRLVEMSKWTYSPRLWPRTSLVDLSGLILASLASDEFLGVRPEEPSIDQVLAGAAEHEAEPGLESRSSVTTVISSPTGKTPGRSSGGSIRSSASASGSEASSQATSSVSREEFIPNTDHDSDGTSEETHNATEKVPARSSDASIRSSASSSGSNCSSQVPSVGTTSEQNRLAVEPDSDSTSEDAQNVTVKAPARSLDDGISSSASSNGLASSSQAAPIGTASEEIMPDIDHDSDCMFEEPQVVQLPEFVKTFYIDSKPRIKLLLEVEEPCSVEAQLSMVAPNDMDDTNKVDIGRLICGEEITVVRKEGESDVCVDLCSGSGAEGRRLTLTWIS